MVRDFLRLNLSLWSAELHPYDLWFDADEIKVQHNQSDILQKKAHILAALHGWSPGVSESAAQIRARYPCGVYGRMKQVSMSGAWPW